MGNKGAFITFTADMVPRRTCLSSVVFAVSWELVGSSALVPVLAAAGQAEVADTKVTRKLRASWTGIGVALS
eukprot:scaffold8319_cov277-Pinguiococcus_pyrenoidosus.AAC.5